MCFLAHKNDAFDVFKSFTKELKKKNNFILLALEIILKMSFLTIIMIKMVFLITILLIKHLKKIG